MDSIHALQKRRIGPKDSERWSSGLRSSLKETVEF